MEGFILVDKPKDMTSYEVVAKIKEITSFRKIGHAGTLDPLATGLLIVLIGKNYTRLQMKFLKMDKEYIAQIRLGIETNTYDLTGEIVNYYYGKLPDLLTIKRALLDFEGESWQIPPPFSAKKIKGIRAYNLARKGKPVVLKPVKIKIYSLQVISYKKPKLKLKLVVSSGTYIRSFAYDLGRKLGCLAALESLKRTRIGVYLLENSVKLDKINKENWKRFIQKV